MKSTDAVKEIMKKQGVKNIDLACRLGVTPAAMWDRLNNSQKKDITVQLLKEMLTAMDYKVVLMPRSARVGEDGIEL